MARLISCATGNFTTNTTWQVSDATSLLDSEAGNTANTTSYVESSAFTPGAITVDGVAIKLASRVTSPTGTASVRIALAGVLVAGTETTINVSDMPTASSATNEGGWILFKLAAPVLLLAATAYTVSIKGSVNAEFNSYRDGTAGNWSRQLRTTTNTAPGAGDIMDIIGEHTGSGTGNSFTVTMNNTAGTDFGSGTDASVAMTIGKRGTLTSGTTSATNYYLRLSGNLIGYNGGTLSIGTNGSEIPRDSTAYIDFDMVANLGMGLVIRNGFTYNSYGLSRTSGKNVVKCRLTSTMVATNTTVNVDTDTGWKSGDEIALAKTVVSNTRQDEVKILSGDAGASSMTITVGVTNTHHGVTPYAGHVVLRTRNVGIRSFSSSLMSYVTIAPTATVNLSWTMFQYVGRSATFPGLLLNTTTGSFNMQYCSVLDNDQCVLTIAASANNITIQNTIFQNFNRIGPNAQKGVVLSATLGSSVVITDNVFMGFSQSGSGSGQNTIELSFNTINFSRNVVTSSALGHPFVFNSNTPLGTFDDNEMYALSCVGDSAAISGAIQQTAPLPGGTINRLIMWHCNGTGGAAWAFTNAVSDLTFNDCIFFGNNNNIKFAPGGVGVNLVFNNLQLNSDNVQTTTRGFFIEAGSAIVNSKVNDSEWGVATGNYTAHTEDIDVTGGYVDLLFDNSTFGSPILINTPSNLSGSSEIKFNKFNTTANNHLWYTKYGIARSTGAGLVDTNVRTSGSLGVRIAPTDSTTGFSWSFQIVAKKQSAVAVSGFIQKNAAFGTDNAKVELFLPGSLVADATQTMGNDTNWNVFNVFANNTQTVDGLATVKITAKTVTSSAYIYVDDIYNGTNILTALDVWDKGKPSPILFEQLGDAAAVWAVATASQTTAGTMGERLKKALTVPLFIALK